jgi:GT2 family glycosyltransferase
MSRPDGKLTGAEGPDDPNAVFRRDLSQAVQAARAELAALDDDNQRAHFEYQLMLTSKARRALLRAHAAMRTVAAGVLRPVDGAGYAVNALANRTGLAAFTPAWEYGRYRSVSLRSSPIVATTSDQPDASRAVRWDEVTRIRGVARQALVCQPSSSATFRIQASPGATLVAHCALMPQAWIGDRDGVRFTMTARSERDGWELTRSRHLNPGRRLGDRRWRAVRIALPITDTDEVTVTLSTSGPAVDSPVVWGDPQLRWRRSPAELMRATRAQLRQSGIRGAFRKVGQLRDGDEAAKLYRLWVARHTLSAEQLAQMAIDAEGLAYQPLISVITPVYNTDPGLLRACIESVRRQAYPNWELCLADDASDSAETAAVLREYGNDPRIKITRLAVNAHISAASNAALAMAGGEFVAMLDHDDELPADALFEVARYLGDHLDADVIYTDEDKLDMAGQRCEPFFKPDWSPELFVSYMYTCHLMVYRRSLVNDIGAFRLGFEGAQDYDLGLRASEHTTRIHHVPKVLYHWRKIPGSAAAVVDAKPYALQNARRALEDHIARRGQAAEVVPGEAPGLFRVKHRITGQPLVSLLVLTDDRTRDLQGRRVRLLPNALASVVQKTAYANYEIVVVDNGNLSEESRAFLETVPHRRVSYAYEGAFNFAHKLNFSVPHARGSQLVFFNDDLEVISSEWLTAMLEYSQQPEIGAVGAKLFFPDGRLQHIGAVLGVCGVTAHAFHMHPGWSTGYAGSAIVPRNYSAVSAACMMTRREVFEAVGGWNERLAIDFNDVDYCLRVRQAGHRVVYTPYAQLFHLESGSHGPRTQNPRELEEMRRTWSAVLARDPYYNPNLTRDFPDYRLRLD